MIAGDTSRSRVYLQALRRHHLLPAHVIVLEDSSEDIFPGQFEHDRVSTNKIIDDLDHEWSEAQFDANLKIKDLLDELNVSYDVSNSKDINNLSVVGMVQNRPESVFIYSGFGGGILRDDILGTGKSFLHVHGGYLPDFKGSTTNYYSLISDDSLGASSLFLNAEIDSGSVLVRRKFSPPPNRKEIDHVYDSAARAKVLIETIQNYAESNEWKFELSEKDNNEGETYFIIHPVLKHIAILAKDNSI
mgnify:CR=1 FL=1